MVSTKNEAPFISVVLPVYNGEKFIAEAIESVLSQGYKPLELIVVNDGSTDGTGEVLKKFEGKITCITQENRGPSNARNRGIHIAKGNYVAFIDADDVWASGHLLFHLGQFKKFKNLEISVGLTNNLEFESAKDLDSGISKENISLHLVLGASLMKRSVFEYVGLFDEELILRQDTDWFLRARENNRMIAIGRKMVLLYRKHSKNRTNNSQMSKVYLFKLLKKAKDRKGVAGITEKITSAKPANMDELIEMWNTVSSKTKG